MTFTQPDGLRTVYYRGGSGRTLVFLHGGGIDAGCYRELLERLAERYDVIAPNLAGHGGSTVPGKGWGWSDYGNLLSKLLDHLGIQGNGIAAAGHSFGGAVAAYLAAQDGRIGKLILIDTAAAAPLDWSFASMCRLMILQRLIDGGRYGKLGLSFKLIGSVAMNFLRNGVYAPATQATMRRLLTRTDGVFSQIKTPTLILWGEQDKVFPFAAAEVVESQLSDGKVEAIDGNHEWCLYQPRLAAEKISAWVG